MENSNIINIKDFKKNNNKIIFLEKIKTALKKGWAGSTQEKNDFIELIEESESGDEEAFKMLENVFQFNPSFKKETGLFKNV